MISTAFTWIRYNLFNKPFDALLSAVVIPSLLWCLWTVLDWALFTAQWDVIPDSFRVLMVGIYPADALWRAWIALLFLSALFGATLGTVFRFKNGHGWLMGVIFASFAALVSRYGFETVLLVLAWGAIAGGSWFTTSHFSRLQHYLIPAWVIGLIGIFIILAPPGVGLWGGLMLSVLITLVTALVTLPLGILLAFGRRSPIPSVRYVCTAYIETMRSVPLILVVYWIWIVMPVLAPELSVPDVARGMIGFSVFFSAYVAEYIRSGLQNVPRGQVEAARSLGLSSFEINRSIVLPQALKVAIPGLVGNVLDVFNAAPLVFIIGLTDFLRAGQMILANPQFGDRTYEVYGFLFVVYFLIGSLITFAARKLELHLAKGSRS